jgi:cation:H+ antiporter
MLPALLEIGALIIGVAILLIGGDLLVRGAVTLATTLGVAPIIVGLTVVAFGTSAPELALNIVAAVNENTDLSFGNVVGSNIANIGLILGLSALVRPLTVHAGVIKRELPIMLAATFGFVALLYAPLLGSERSINALTPVEGGLLLAGFTLFMALLIRDALRGRNGDNALQREAEELVKEEKAKSTPIAILLAVGGLVLLTAGGRASEWGAVALAQRVGLSQELIGLTVVAIATSLPELATSITAIRRGETDIAVGNVVGSNVFNLLLVMGVTAQIHDVPLPAGGGFTLGLMCLLSVLLLPMSVTVDRTVSRIEGGVLLAIFIGGVGARVAYVLAQG